MIGPNILQFEFLGQFLAFESVDIFDFAYHGRKMLYFIKNGGVVA